MKIGKISIQEHIKNFGRKKLTFEYKENQLEKKGIIHPYTVLIASLDDEKYKRAIYLLNRGVDFKCVQDIAGLDKEKYKQAVTLVQKGIFDNFLKGIAELDKKDFNKALNFRKLGLPTDCLKLFAELNEKELEIARTLMLKNGYTPIVAGNLAKLSEEERKTATDFLELAEIDIACNISKLDRIKQEKCKTYLEKGINSNCVIEISELSEDEEKRLPEIFDLQVGDINITDFAKMSEKEYKRAKELLSLGVNPNAIYDIILIEEKEGENDEYTTYRERGYSYTSSASLSALNNFQIDALEKLVKMHPEIKELFKEEYDVNVIQLQTDDIQEAILTRTINLENGTRITLVQTFDGYGDKTQSRLETYKDGSTSSMMKNKTGVYKAKYDRYGQIKELTELIQDFDTHEVTGVIHSKASKLLTGVMESTYYDIKDFKESTNGTPDEEIEKSVISEGTQLSSVKQNTDGSIRYTEDFQINDYLIKRSYTEKRDKDNNITNSNYSYKITHADTDEELMNISRSFIKKNDNTATNIINGIEYNLEYDNKTKKILISDNNQTKILDFSKVLPEFSQEIIWDVIKQLHVDSLLTINKYVDKWQYTQECDSLVDEYNKILSSGTNTDIITHEIGHIKTNQNKSILTNDELVQIYGKEMDIFKINMPYNEQEFIQYFSQRADLMDSDGLSEFVAETNAILTTYGINHKELNTRAQFLTKYFPLSIAKIAELLGKTSTKSLLE